MQASEDDKKLNSSETGLVRQGVPHGLSGQIQYDESRRGAPKELAAQITPNSAGGEDNKKWQTPDTGKVQHEQKMQQWEQQAREAQRPKPHVLDPRIQHYLEHGSPSTAQNSVSFEKEKPNQHVEGTISAEGSGGLRLDSIEGDVGVSLPRTMNTAFDPFVRGTPPPTKKPSGAPLQTIDKRVPQYYKDPEEVDTPEH